MDFLALAWQGARGRACLTSGALYLPSVNAFAASAVPMSPRAIAAACDGEVEVAENVQPLVYGDDHHVMLARETVAPHARRVGIAPTERAAVDQRQRLQRHATVRHLSKSRAHDSNFLSDFK